MLSLRRVLNKFLAGKIVILVLLSLSFLTLPVLVYNYKYVGKIFPGISIAGIEVGGLSPPQAKTLLEQKIPRPLPIKLVYLEKSFDLEPNTIDLTYDFSESSTRAYNRVRRGNILNDIFERLKLFIYPENIGLATKLDEDKLQKFIATISKSISKRAVHPSVSIVGGNILVNKGLPGIDVDENLLRAEVGAEFSLAKNTDINIPLNNIDDSLNDQEAYDFKIRAGKYIGKNLQVKFEFTTLTFDSSALLKLLEPKKDFNDTALNILIEGVATKIERDPQNPKFNFEGGKVTEFQPSLDGVKIERDKFKDLLINSLKALETNDDKNIILDPPVVKTPSEVSTDKVNDLGIKELVGRGTSTFYHSIPGRVHNVVLAASRINGTLVKPGDTFSFNNTLGDVSAFTGFQQAYIISEGKTILGDGGGVCQVSTTLFRALLNAGLPITDRTAHAYRVGYYEQNSPPGLDATVYGPEPDLKFINDTPAYILIEAKADPQHYSLIFELYGTSDGRVATITKPVVSNVTPALPTIYQDDPTLPVGTLKQTDFSAAGATVTFTYKVERFGINIISRTFVSNYRPWAAVYLRGVKI